MRVLLVSFGSIARRHLANLRRLEPDADVLIVRRTIDPGLHERQVSSFDEALAWRPEAALICSPATEHLRFATSLIEQHVPLFVEKPLAAGLDGGAALVARASALGVPFMVGYCLRFSMPLRTARESLQAGDIGRLLHLRAEVGQYLPDWRPASDYRSGVTAQSALGGGALLELSHEIDYARWFGGEVATVSGQLSRIGGLDIDVEDTADLSLRFREGATGIIHLDLLARPAYRHCRVIATDGTIEVDLIEGRVRAFRADVGVWRDLLDPPVDRDAMYRDELKEFLGCVRRGTSLSITGEDGLRVLEIVEAARRSDREARVIEL